MPRRESFLVFLSAFLLFQVQPYLGRYILPWFGGSPAVWLGCMLVFQTLLLAGYAYAHWLTRRAVHLTLLAASLLFLPMVPNPQVWKPLQLDQPMLQTALLLLGNVGLPYLILASTGPLIQRWVYQAGDNPYRLYAYSNAGSLLGLLTYPFLVEPLLALPVQGYIWSAGYVLFALLIAHRTTNLERESHGSPPTGDFLHWTALAACGSALLVTTTNQISQDIAASPFLWVLPLSLYLLTFLLTFDREGNYQRIAYALRAAILIPAACAATIIGLRLPLGIHLLIACTALFVCAMLCHGELARSKPDPSKLTSFYLAIALGGAIGSGVVALLAPHWATSSLAEYPISFAACGVLTLYSWYRDRFTSPSVWFRLARTGLAFSSVIALLSLQGMELTNTITTTRNFFGILRVTESNGQRSMKHGRVTHGAQFLDPAKRLLPTSYYGSDSGIGLAMRYFPRHPLRAAIVGLGAGTAAAHGKPGDSIRFYEINPDVERLAREYFTFLRDSPAETTVVAGDARIRLEQETAAPFDILAIDAFSSDAIPAHLVTREAVRLYLNHLVPDGLLLFHVTNQYLDLPPLVRGLGSYFRLTATLMESAPDDNRGTSRSTWVLLTTNRAYLANPDVARQIVPWPAGGRQTAVWTDDRINLFPILRDIPGF